MGYPPSCTSIYPNHGQEAKLQMHFMGTFYASTEVGRELKSTSDVCPCGRCQSGGWSSLACPRGGISRAPRGGVQLFAHTLRGPLHAEFACRFERARWP